MSRSRGFTLIELLVVIAIIALLAGVILASLNSAREKGRLAAGKQFESSMYGAEADQAVAIWDFDEGTGTTIADRSGNGNNGTLTGTSPATMWSTDTPTGKGYSLSFDGSTQYVDIPAPSFTSIQTQVTISFWYKSSVPSMDGCPFSMYSRLDLRLTSANTTLVVNGGNANLPAYPKDGLWHQAAITFDDPTDLVIEYIDGKQVGTVTQATPIPALSGAVHIGKRVGNPNFFNGLMDNMRIYAKNLTAVEIGKLYALELSSHHLAATIQ